MGHYYHLAYIEIFLKKGDPNDKVFYSGATIVIYSIYPKIGLRRINTDLPPTLDQRIMKLIHNLKAPTMTSANGKSM